MLQRCSPVPSTNNIPTGITVCVADAVRVLRIISIRNLSIRHSDTGLMTYLSTWGICLEMYYMRYLVTAIIGAKYYREISQWCLQNLVK